MKDHILEKRKLYHNTKKTYYTLINENTLKKIGVYNNKIVLSLYVTKDFNLCLLISKKEIQKKNIIYFERLELKKNNNKSKDYRLMFKSLFTDLLISNNFYYSLEFINVDKVNCFKVIFS